MAKTNFICIVLLVSELYCFYANINILLQIVEVLLLFRMQIS